jgi:hypothetical protein
LAQDLRALLRVASGLHVTPANVDDRVEVGKLVVEAPSFASSN